MNPRRAHPVWRRAALARGLRLGLMGWCAVSAAALQIDFLYPAGGPRDSIVAVSAGGVFDAWPVRVWTDDPGLVFTAAEAPGHFVARITAEVQPRPHLVRFHHGTAVSEPRWWIVGDGPEITEVIGGDAADLPPIDLTDLPVVVNSRLPVPGARREFALSLDAGVELIAEMVGHGLDAPLAARLRLLDAGGTVVASSESHPPRDPRLTTPVVLAGSYRLLIDTEPVWAASRPVFAGSPAAVFRLGLNLRAQDDAPARPRPEYLLDVPVLKPPAPPSGLADRHTLLLRPGEARSLAVQIRRQEITEQSRRLLTLFATGLPDGITCPAVSSSPETDSTAMSFAASTNVAAFSGPFEITLVDAQASMPVATNVKASLTGRFAAPHDLLVRETKWFWLVVQP